jgi:3-hydroxyacyl-[acyl-carrier-protein] dehydratase
MMDAAAIEAVIPHRSPFRFVDEIVEIEPGVRAVGRWTISGEEWFLAGHFPGNPIVPGVIMVEALAQTAAVCALVHPDHTGKFGVFAAIDETRFTRIVRPGDVLSLEVTMDRLRGRLGRCSALITVAGEVAVRGTLTFGLLEEPPA